MKFAIITIIKNEHKFLDEWLSYHINLGIDEIFVYEDINSLSHKDICNKYNNVTLKSVESLFTSKHDKVPQIIAFKNILKHIQYKYDYDWAFYIDADEFITFEKDGDTFSTIFENFQDYGFVSLQWLNYNANGHIFSKENVIESYTETCGFLEDAIIHHSGCKMAYNLKKYHDLKKVKFNHHDANGMWCKTNFSLNKDDVVYDKIFLRHYITKSFEDWIYKIYCRGQFYNSKKFNDFFILNPDMDEKKLLPLKNSFIKKYGG